jgi:methionyl aminopeptidase
MLTIGSDSDGAPIIGKKSAQFEHTMVVTETGVEVLTARVPGQTPSGPHWFQDVEAAAEGGSAAAE